jgi:bacillithiol biosynthesis deacetylase BshB1
MKKRFLFVSPHPDDAELGAGGLILKLKRAGHAVDIVDMSSGEPTPYGSEEKRKRETERATRLLGIDSRTNLGLRNRYIFDDEKSRLLLAGRIRLLRPDALFAPHPVDAHPDHVAVSQIATGARFYAKYTKLSVPGTPHYTPRLFYYFCSHLRVPPDFGFLVDISGQFGDKMKVVRCYRSQFVANEKNRFVFDYIKNLNAYLGSLAQADYAEAFAAAEAVRVDDLSALI